MAWTYSGDPAGSNRDEVRFLCGDTDTNDQLVNDAEIAWAITEEGNNQAAAANICEHLASKFARKVDKTVGPTKLLMSQKSTAFAERANELRGRVAVIGATPYAGGISIADKQTYEDDTDRVEPFFGRRQFDHPGTSQYFESAVSDYSE